MERGGGSQERGLTLRGKIQGGDKAGKDACLVLLMASERLLNQPRPTATMVAKWLRASGYPIGRMDRTLQDAISQGELLSRARAGPGATAHGHGQDQGPPSGRAIDGDRPGQAALSKSGLGTGRSGMPHPRLILLLIIFIMLHAEEARQTRSKR